HPRRQRLSGRAAARNDLGGDGALRNLQEALRRRDVQLALMPELHAVADLVEAGHRETPPNRQARPRQVLANAAREQVDVEISEAERLLPGIGDVRPVLVSEPRDFAWERSGAMARRVGTRGIDDLQRLEAGFPSERIDVGEAGAAPRHMRKPAVLLVEKET